jgi:hypothetical protein
MDMGDASGIVNGMATVSGIMYSPWFWAAFFVCLIVLYIILIRRGRE